MDRPDAVDASLSIVEAQANHHAGWVVQLAWRGKPIGRDRGLVASNLMTPHEMGRLAAGRSMAPDQIHCHVWRSCVELQKDRLRVPTVRVSSSEEEKDPRSVFALALHMMANQTEV
jgi:hypothetical protein